PRTMPVVLTRSVGTPQGPVAGSPTGAQPFSRADQDAALAPKRSTKPSASTKDPRPDTETILSKATPQASKAQLAPAQGKEPERIMRAKIMVDNITAKTISIPAGGFRDQPPKTVYVPMYVQAPPVAQATATPPPTASFIPGALTDRFRIGSNAPRGQPKTTTAASNSANNAPAQARNAPVLAQAPIVVNISQDAPRNRTHYYTAEEADKPQVRDTSIPRPDFSGRNLDQEYAQAQVHAAHEKEQERLDIAQVKQAIQDNFRGKVDDRQLKELTDNVQRLLESHSIQTDFIKERLAHADSSQILDSFMAMVRMIEEQRPKTETIQMVPEEFKNYRPNLKKEAPKAESRELENKELITDYDKILEVVRSKGKISVDTLAKNAQIDKKALREILSVLEKEELIDVQYPPFGSPVVIDLLAKRKKEGKE
ncbi:MAG: hypothetical protein Q7R47_05940, partial [Candidatus Diapherotrites archaeon]|nr:hypothetical protein [Candidatus Diapherotrites archaeon]